MICTPLFPETMAMTPQQQALGMDEIILGIYGFALGTKMNTIGEMLQMRLVSPRFNTCFMAYLDSAPLKLSYTCNDDDPKETPLLQWMKRHKITILSELDIYVEGRDLLQLSNDLAGMDFSKLSVLRLIIFSKNPGRYSTDGPAQSTLSLLAEASSVTHLTLFDHDSISQSRDDMYEDFLSYFPILKSLDVNFHYRDAVNSDGATRVSEEAPHLERLVRHDISGNFTFRSESLKVLDLSSCFLDSIRLDCHSLEEIVCQNPIVIGDVSGLALAEEFGNSDRAFIHRYLESVEHQICCSDVEFIASISIIPSDSIVSSDSFQVGNDCRIILFTFND